MLPPNPRDESPADDHPPDLFRTMPPMQLVLLGITLVFMEQVLLGLLNAAVPNFYLAILLAVGLTFFAIPRMLIGRSGGSWSTTLRLHRLTGPQWGWTLLASVALILPVNLMGEWNMRLIPPPEDFAAVMEDLRPDSAMAWILATLTVAMVVPLGEEIVFRGLMQRAARDHLPGPLAAVLVGALFGVLHFEPWYVLGLVTMGIAMGLAYEFTGSLWAAVAVHTVYNAIALAAFVIPEDASSVYLELTGPGMTLAVASGAISVWALARLRRTPAPVGFPPRPADDWTGEGR